MANLDALSVNEKLRRLSRVKARIFGADGHGFMLNPPLPEIEISRFEAQHKIHLSALGNGGAGPYYGVFRLGKWDGSGWALEDWHEGGGLIGILSKPFPFRKAWNDLEGIPATICWKRMRRSTKGS